MYSKFSLFLSFHFRCLYFKKANATESCLSMWSFECSIVSGDQNLFSVPCTCVQNNLDVALKRRTCVLALRPRKCNAALKRLACAPCLSDTKTYSAEEACDSASNLFFGQGFHSFINYSFQVGTLFAFEERPFHQFEEPIILWF